MLIAYEKELDLVEVAPNAKPPVCKLIDYSKYLYDLEKQERHQRSKGKSPELKEIRLSLKIDTHDLEIKAKKAKTFLDKGSRVRVFLQLRGREMAFQDKVIPMIDHFKEVTGAEYEQAPSRLGNRFNAIIKSTKG